MNEQLKKYYRSIRHNLPCSVKLRRQIMERINQDIAAYLEENPQADMEAVQQHFGTPRQIADACIEEMTPSEILNRFKTKRTVIIVICVTMVLALLMWAITLGIAWLNEKDSADGFYDVGPVIESNVEVSE